MKANYGANRKGKSNTANYDIKDMRGEGLSVTKLRQEKNFTSYLKLLKDFAKRYTLLISVCNTPCGPYFTESMAAEVMNLGLRMNLFNCFRAAYVAVINAGELLEERISPTMVEWEGRIGECNIKMLSAGWNANKNRNTAVISIDGKDYAPNSRGFNFVLFDAVTKTVLDACCFDTYDAHFTCNRPADKIDKLKEYRKTHEEVNIVCFNMPKFPKENLSKNEVFIARNSLSIGLIMNNLDKPIFALNKYYASKEDIAEVLTPPKSYIDIYGVRRFEDTHGKCVNTANGIRVTKNQPVSHKRSIFILGGCTLFGVGSSDGCTVASKLQEKLNRQAPKQGFIVNNYGYYLADLTGYTTGEEFTILNALPAKPGDIVLFPFREIDGFPFFDLSKAAARPHNYGEVFFDIMHYTPDGNRLIADKLYDCLNRYDFFTGSGENGLHIEQHPQPEQKYNGLDSKNMAKLEKYKNILREYYNSMFGIKIGCVVMNCNPFTLGHRYLIEQALLKCDYLMVFIVQEDKSIFPFKDRIKLADEGVADLKNVTVIPSGNFIISSLTFSEYFNKSNLQEHTINPSLDLTIFAREIAPCLHITTRFAGDEPFDNVTRQYNEAMRAMLPQYGIEFVEIPRKKSGETAISASRVRELLKDKNFDEISSLVPETTLKYLLERFNGENS